MQSHWKASFAQIIAFRRSTHFLQHTHALYLLRINGWTEGQGTRLVILDVKVRLGDGIGDVPHLNRIATRRGRCMQLRRI